MFYTTNILQSLEKSGESKTEIMENLNHVQKHKGGKVDSLSYCPNLTHLALSCRLLKCLFKKNAECSIP